MGLVHSKVATWEAMWTIGSKIMHRVDKNYCMYYYSLTYILVTPKEGIQIVFDDVQIYSTFPNSDVFQV